MYITWTTVSESSITPSELEFFIHGQFTGEVKVYHEDDQLAFAFGKAADQVVFEKTGIDFLEKKIRSKQKARRVIRKTPTKKRRSTSRSKLDDYFAAEMDRLLDGMR